MYRTTVGLVILLGSACLSAQASESETAEERFLAEYPAAAKRIENYYKHVKIYFTEIDKFRHEVVDYEFSRNGDSIRLVELDRRNDEPLSAYVVDPDVIFKLQQDTFKSPFSVTDLGKGSRSDQMSWANLVLSKAPPSRAPYGAYLPGSIADLLSNKALKVKSVQRSQDGTIVVNWEGVPPGLAKSRGSFTFLPDSCWALRDYTIIYTDLTDVRTKQARPDSGLYGNLEYGRSDQGIPLIDKLRTWTSKGSEIGPELMFEVKDINYEIVPKREFTLESFAVPIRPAPAQVPVAYYLLALSAFCGFLVIVLRYLRNRSSHTSGVT